ncbi:hypothetical protein ACFQDN_19245 [Pseudomonas asuensis]
MGVVVDAGCLGGIIDSAYCKQTAQDALDHVIQALLGDTSFLYGPLQRLAKEDFRIKVFA